MNKTEQRVPWPASRVLALERAVREMAREYVRAASKHGERTNDGDETLDRDRLANLVEEVGEVARCMTYDQDSRGLYMELIQVANLALAWAGYLDRASGEVARSYSSLPHRLMTCTICGGRVPDCGHDPDAATFKDEDVPERIGGSLQLMFPQMRRD